MVELKVTHSKFDKTEFADCVAAPTRSGVIAAWLNDFSDNRIDSDALITLLSRHDDFRFATPTWELHFELSYKP